MTWRYGNGLRSTGTGDYSMSDWKSGRERPGSGLRCRKAVKKGRSHDGVSYLWERKKAKKKKPHDQILTVLLVKVEKFISTCEH